MTDQLTFKSDAQSQCHMGRINGIYRTWMAHGTFEGKMQTHSDRDSALQAHEDNIKLLKLKARIEA